MSKLSKTSYPRQPNQNNFLFHAQKNKQKKIVDDEDSTNTKLKFHRQQNPNLLNSIIQKKVQVDSALLFNHKNQQKSAKPHQQYNKDLSIQRQLMYTSTDGFNQSAKDRPQSKQQSRVRPIDNFSLNKRKEEFPIRPQTSKGQRVVIYDERNTTLGDCDNEIEIKRNAKTTFGSRKKYTAKQLQLQTAIDPQFLALFAS